MGRVKKLYLRDPETGKKTEMYYTLKGLGQLCLDKYKGKISTTLAQRYHPRLATIMHTNEKMPAFLRLLKKIDSKYGAITYTPRKGGLKNRSFLSEEQDSILRSHILGNLKTIDEGSLEEKEKLYFEINNDLVKAGAKQRNTDAIAKLVYNRLYGRKELPSTLHKGKPPKSIGEKVEQDTRAIEEKEVGGLEEICGTKSTRRKNRKEIETLTPIGHQKLIAYLMDPKNYFPVFGRGTEIVCVDFKADDTDPELYNAFKDKVKNIEEHTEEDKIIEMADGWLRFDILYRKPNGQYVIAEIKQRAINKLKEDSENIKLIPNENGGLNEISISEGRIPQFDNGLKALKQIGAYRGLLKEIVRKRDFENRKDPNHVELKIPVEAHLFAYEIDKELFNYLNKEEGRGAHLFSRESVNKYLAKVMRSAPVKTEKFEQSQETKEPTKEETESREENLRKMHREEMLYQIRNNNFQTFVNQIEELSGIESNATIDEKEGVIESNGLLYEMGRSREHLKIIKRLIKKGIINRGHINIMKYNGQARVQI